MSIDVFSLGEIEMIGGLENCKLPDPQLLDYYNRRKDRVILWNDEINDSFVEVYQDILRWNKEDNDSNIEPKDRKPIKVYINSDGGSVSAVFSIIDLIRMSKTPVITIGLGKCYSAGGLLLMAGDTRYILPSTTILIHDGRSGAYGDTGKMLDNLEFTKKLEDRVRDYVLRMTNISPEEYDKNYRRDWWIFSDDAIEYGIADIIATDIAEIL